MDEILCSEVINVFLTLRHKLISFCGRFCADSTAHAQTPTGIALKVII